MLRKVVEWTITSAYSKAQFMDCIKMGRTKRLVTGVKVMVKVLRFDLRLLIGVKM